MVRETIINFFKSFAERMYIKTLQPDKQIHGYFDSAEMLESSLALLEDNVTLYFNAQSIDEEYLAKIPYNQFGVIQKGGGLKDDSVTKVKYIVVDIDVLSRNESSKDENNKLLATPEENAGAVQLAKEISACLTDYGFTGVGVCNSGNGAYVIIPMKTTSNVASAVDYTVRFVTTLGKNFNRDIYAVDSKVCNEARIFKLPGSLSRKGKATEDIPYRHAEVVEPVDFTQCNPWVNVQEYIRNNSLATNLLYITSSGKIKWDMDAVAEEAVNFFIPFKDQYANLYAQEGSGAGRRIYKVLEEDFGTAIRKWIRKCTGKAAIPLEVVDVAKTMVTDIAVESEPVTLYHRVCPREQEILYNLGANDKVVQITPFGVSIVKCPERTFYTDASDATQVEPDLTVNPKEVRDLLRPFFNITEEKDFLLMLTFLGCSFLGLEISHPIMFFEGAKGAAKTTATKWLQSIISPKNTGLYRFPNNERDLNIMLNRELFLCFDNLGGIKKDIADVLCQTVTGGINIERKLYTNDEVVTRSLKSILVLNGLALLSNKEDLLDRVLVIRLERVSSEKRKTDKELMDAFEAVKPKIIGGIFHAVSEVLSMEIQPVQHKIRLYDYQEQAIKFAIAFGWTQEEAENAFKDNRDSVNMKVVEENPITLAIMNLMDKRNNASYSATELFELTCSGDVPGKPQSPSAFTRKLENLRSDLEAVGITFDKINTGHYKRITLYNNGKYVMNKDTYEASEEYQKFKERNQRSKTKAPKIIKDNEEDELADDSDMKSQKRDSQKEEKNNGSKI